MFCAKEKKRVEELEEQVETLQRHMRQNEESHERNQERDYEKDRELDMLKEEFHKEKRRFWKSFSLELLRTRPLLAREDIAEVTNFVVDEFQKKMEYRRD